ncbi:MAG TPA: YkgJ family cysteine cluster protein [Candidatus Bilamarchaeum sp.]|nr:YkgJ family cysteine cluster protein [Candidatus Bilamarchaeum sp.]
MGTTFSVRDMIASRPQDARRRIYTAFEGQDCLSCGKCCKEGAELTIFRNEPGLVPLRRKAERIKPAGRASVREAGATATISFADDSCAFLSEGNACSVYAMRPLLCRVFPFTIFDSGDVKYVALTSMCPPLGRVAESGVGFLYFSDISRPIGEIIGEPGEFPPSVLEMAVRLRAGGDAEGLLHIPLLSGAIQNLPDLIESFRHYLSVRASVIHDPARGEALFPIF